ncbi:serine hydrolase domain-containing protein [Leucobacter soli]|uniref:Beta-lactamase-related domain-containing protein n=1 Tax=Leucobacter soli TaxID=2812850 RepID=A0A916JXL4_9MICO|nr:serine hydrolase domain-containing protein [Leucobacter soli]CAG7613495.1 hypothetical protein LEUCIP111803_01702 [Leucobacter soli]
MGIRLGRRARLAAVAAVSAAALGLAGCSAGGVLAPADATANTVGADLSAGIEAAVSTAMELSGSTAAVVGVWTSGGDYVQGFGDGVTANTRIRGAQATQPVMCALLLDLVAEGQVQLDRELSEDLPRQVGIEGITYGQLCTAKSGLADFKPRIASIFANNPARQWPEGELLAQGLARSPLSWPGLDVHVADTNTLLLARALNAVTGTAVDELLERHVFSKAGMSSSSYPRNVLTETTGSDVMTGLTRQFKGKNAVCDVDPMTVSKVSPSMLSGAGATVTTISDLKGFYEQYLDGAFGGESAGVVTEASPTDNPKRDKNGEPTEEIDEDAGSGDRFWGFGLERRGPLWGMSGSMTGTLTAAYHDPESGLSVVVSLNNSSSGPAFARALALELAALTGADVPWSAEDQAEKLEDLAVCG